MVVRKIRPLEFTPLGEMFGVVKLPKQLVKVFFPNIRMAIDRHWAASAAGDQVAEHDIYLDDAVCEYPQSGEIIHGRRNLQALRSHHPARPSGFEVRRIVGEGSVWVTEYVITYEGKRVYTVSIMEFRDGKVAHETQYFGDPFDAPAWRSQWVEREA